MATKKTTTKKPAAKKALAKKPAAAAKKPAAKKSAETKASAKKGAAKKAPAKKPADGNVGDAHEKVQLWEGGPYWATTNIGAEKPEDFGYYFWWGDTIGYKRENDNWVAIDGSSSDFSFEGKNVPSYNEDCEDLEEDGWITSQGVLAPECDTARPHIITKGVLAPEHDAAHVQWGGEWRMPTAQELDDLDEKCDWIWKTVNGVKGYVVRGRGKFASASIFLPPAGRGYGTSLSIAHGFYWSSVPNSGSSSGHAWYLSFDSSYHSPHTFYHRFCGQSVRPVQGFTK